MINQEKPLESKKRGGAPLWFIILFALILVAGAIGIGYGFTHPNDYKNSLVSTFDPVPAGVLLKYDFAPKLIPLLPSESTGGPYSFYLGSGVGFPPMGLKLDMNGVLKGTPTGTGDSKFQVCVKDVGGRSACRTYVMSVGPKTTTKTTSNTNSTGNSGQNTNVIQGTTRTEKWVGTYTNHTVDDTLGTVCTYETTAPISICLTRQGQNFEGPINFPNGFKETSYTADPTDMCIGTRPDCIGENSESCSQVAGHTDSSGNLKLTFLTLKGGSYVYDPNYPNYPAGQSSAVMDGNSMIVTFSNTYTGRASSMSEKGNFTATKVSDSCK